MLNALILFALSVVPVYTNHNRVAGNVQTMTNIQEWAAAVENGYLPADRDESSGLTEYKTSIGDVYRFIITSGTEFHVRSLMGYPMIYTQALDNYGYFPYVLLGEESKIVKAYYHSTDTNNEIAVKGDIPDAYTKTESDAAFAKNEIVTNLYESSDWLDVTNGISYTALKRDIIDATNGLTNAKIEMPWMTNGLSTIQADGTWVTRTNETAGVSVTNALCTVAAASAMTNALPNWTKSAYKPSYTASEVGALPNNAVIESISKGIYTVNGDLNVSTNGYGTWTPSSPMPDYVIRWWWADDTYIPGDYDLRADTTLYGEVSMGRYEPELGNPNKRNKVSGPESAPDYFTCSISRVPYSRLALTNDIPDVSSFVTGETATNIVRSVNGGIWDADLNVWWTPVMSNGKLTYQATTNVNLNAGN